MNTTQNEERPFDFTELPYLEGGTQRLALTEISGEVAILSPEMIEYNGKKHIVGLVVHPKDKTFCAYLWDENGISATGSLFNLRMPKRIKIEHVRYANRVELEQYNSICLYKTREDALKYMIEDYIVEIKWNTYAYETPLITDVQE